LIVIPGRVRKRVNPESSAAAAFGWIPASRLKARPGMTGLSLQRLSLPAVV
jgi:hypothetical protein